MYNLTVSIYYTKGKELVHCKCLRWIRWGNSLLRNVYLCKTSQPFLRCPWPFPFNLHCNYARQMSILRRVNLVYLSTICFVNYVVYCTECIENKILTAIALCRATKWPCWYAWYCFRKQMKYDWGVAKAGGFKRKLYSTKWCMSPLELLWGPLIWHPIISSSHCIPFEDQIATDFILGYPIFKWVVVS